MTKQDIEAFDTVEELNQELFEKLGEKIYASTPLHWEIMSNGTVTQIEFNGFYIWDSENDERKYLEDSNEHEPLKPYLLKKLQKYHTLIGNYLSAEEEEI